MTTSCLGIYTYFYSMPSALYKNDVLIVNLSLCVFSPSFVIDICDRYVMNVQEGAEC